MPAPLPFFFGLKVEYRTFIPLPYWMSCHASAIDIASEYIKWAKRKMRRCTRKEAGLGTWESLEPNWRHQKENNNPSGCEFIKNEQKCEKWKEGIMMREEQENELSTCQRIKALSCHILAPTHSSPQCFKLMSQVPISGFCSTLASSHSHYRSAVQGDNLSPWTQTFYFRSPLSQPATFILSCYCSPVSPQLQEKNSTCATTYSNWWVWWV